MFTYFADRLLSLFTRERGLKSTCGNNIYQLTLIEFLRDYNNEKSNESTLYTI